MGQHQRKSGRNKPRQPADQLRLYFYRANQNFPAPAYLNLHETWLTPEWLVAQPTGDSPAGLSPATVVSEPEDADFFVFPYWLGSVVNQVGVSGIRQFVASLPLFSGHEDRHVFALEHNVSSMLDIRSVVFHTSVNGYHKDAQVLSYPFRVQDFGDAVHFDYSRMKYHTSFVGYLNSWSGRPSLVESIRSETRLRALLDPVAQFHRHWASGAVREERRKAYIASLADSITVLCPRGAGQNTIRFFEALSMGRIPILVSDTCALPFEDEIDYASFTLRIPEAALDRAGSILAEWLTWHTPEQIIAKCRTARQVWEQYFGERQMLVQTVRALHRLKMAGPTPASGVEVPSGQLTPPIARETTWLASGFHVWLGHAGAMLEANGVQGFLIPGDAAYLFHTARWLPMGATVVEIGSFMGLSAILMANGLVASRNHAARIYCVDTWEGSPEHQSMSVVRERGLFDHFLANVRTSGVAGLIHPIRKPSIEAAGDFAPGSIDMVFVDGDHSCQACYADLEAWYPRLRPGGLFIGHDCAPDSGVRQAVDEFAGKHGLTCSITNLPATHYVFELRPVSAVLTADNHRGESFASWGLPNATFAVVRAQPSAVEEAVSGARTQAADDLVETLHQVEKAHAKGKWKRAARLLQQALELSVAVPASPADQATLWNSLGYAHMMRQRLPAAEAAFQKGLALNPHHRDLLANLANLSMQSGRFEQAFGCLQRATQLEPSDASLLIALGKCALELGMLDVALDSFRKALAITPDNEDLQNAVMQLQAREGR